MGMFDEIKVNLDLLPLNDDERNILANDIFQTKSLHRCMDEYEISKEGKLLLHSYRIESTPYEPDNSKDWTVTFGKLKRIFERTSIVDYHGIINFYGVGKDDKIYEFNAKFTDGNLVTIVRLENEG